MKKVTLGLIIVIAISAFSFVSSQSINSDTKAISETGAHPTLKGADKSGYTEANENSW